MTKARRFVPTLMLVVLLALLIAPLAATAAPLQEAPRPGCAQTYVVQRGDTLSAIAARYHTTAWALASINGIANVNYIYAGQRLCVSTVTPPGPNPPGPIPAPGPGSYYTVRWGDTLSAIAARTGWSAAYLAQVNHLANPNFIFAGQKLLIPNH
jgi:LysM repeat protein